MPSSVIVAGPFHRHERLFSLRFPSSFLSFFFLIFSLFYFNQTFTFFLSESGSFFACTDECSLKTRREASSDNAACF